MPLAPERIDFKVNLAVRAEAGFFFGMARSLHNDRLLFEVEAPLQPAEVVELRVTLSPGTETALLYGRVLRSLIVAAGESPRWLAQIDRIEPQDRTMFEAWLQNRKSGGTYSNFSGIGRASGVFGGMSQAGASDVRAALARLAQKDPARSDVGDPFGLRSDVSNSAGGGARTAMRDALRKAVQAPGTPAAPTAAPASGMRAAPLGSPVSDPSRPAASTLPGAPAAAAPAPGAPAAPVPPRPTGAGLGAPAGLAAPRAPGTAPGAPAGLGAPRAPAASVPAVTPTVQPPSTSEPVATVFESKDASYLQLRWTTRAAFAAAARTLLDSSVVRVPRTPDFTPPTRSTVRLIAQFGAHSIDSEATLAAQASSGIVYRASLDATRRSALEAALNDAQ